MKKLTKNNKGFSLIELIIVIAIMAVLVAIIAPNLTKYLGSSKKNTDKKNADELASQIQTCITDYETNYTTLSAFKVSWNASGATVTPANATLQGIINDTITSETKSKEKGTYATADITKSGDKYTIVATVGSESVKK